MQIVPDMMCTYRWPGQVVRHPWIESCSHHRDSTTGIGTPPERRHHVGSSYGPGSSEIVPAANALTMCAITGGGYLPHVLGSERWSMLNIGGTTNERRLVSTALRR